MQTHRNTAKYVILKKYIIGQNTFKSIHTLGEKLKKSKKNDQLCNVATKVILISKRFPPFQTLTKLMKSGWERNKQGK